MLPRKPSKVLVRIGLVILTFHLLLLITGKEYIWKAVWYNFPDIYDHEIFFNSHIYPSPHPQPWDISSEYNKTKSLEKLTQLHSTLKSTAHIVIKDGAIAKENYWDEGDTALISNSFSMAKSYVSALIGFAIQDGYIKSVDQHVGDFLPYFRKDGKEKITIKHLLQMSSGLNWDESYTGPLSVTTQAYYDTDLTSLVEDLEVKSEPGKRYNYLSGDTQILGLLLNKATGYSVSEYLHLKIWNPLGAENEALWSTDILYGNEKAYCCLNATARDFARFGQFYLNKGKWNGTQLLNTDYIEKSLAPTGLPNSITDEPCDFYGYQWWLIPNYKGNNIFYARGILGQFIICIPEKNIVIVRLGHERGELEDKLHHKLTYALIDDALNL